MRRDVNLEDLIRSRKILQNEYSIGKIGCGTAENEPSEVIIFAISQISEYKSRVDGLLLACQSGVARICRARANASECPIRNIHF